MSKQVSIRYQFYQVISEDEKTPYDFINWMEHVQPLTLEERVKENGDITGRLEETVLVEEDYYAMNFMRMGLISNSYILKADKEAQHVDLNEDEYIANNTVVLYYARKNIMMIQCNRGSYGVAGIESYINSFEGMPRCRLRPIKYDGSDRMKAYSKYLKLEIRFANVNAIEPHSDEFERLISPAREMGGETAHIEIGLGYNRKREKELYPETIKTIVDDIRDERNRQSIRSAKVTLDDDRKSVVLDLIDGILDTKISFSIPDRGELEFDMMGRRMQEEFAKRILAIIVNLNIR